MPMEPRLDEPGDQFPIGMRVLAVDDDPTCLRVLETLLTRCQYRVTTTNQATTALKMLRENKFDLVISDVHMPDMDGFKLLELVGLEMDLPVIMLSANGDPKLVMKGIDHGACDYLLKPIRIEELKNIWQHVIRKKKHDPKDQNSSGNQERHQYGSGDTQFSGNADQNENINRKRKDQDDDDENDDMGHENDDPSAQKKPRVVWSVDLHRKFVLAVNQLGLDKAVPKKILDLMNVEKLSRENVASHLQKYRLYLKRISNAANQQANMVAAMGNTDPNYMRVGSMNGIGSYHSLVGSGQFQNSLYNTFPSNGMLGRLNTPLSLGMRGLPSSGGVQMGHAQNSTNDQAKFQPVVFPGNHSGNILQGMPMSLELDQLHNNNGVTIGGLSNAVDDMTIFPVSSGFPDAKVTTNPLLGAPSNPLMVGHLQESQGSRSFGNRSSISMASLNSDVSSHIPDHGRCNSNWSNAVHSSGAQANSFPLSDSFQHTNSLRDKVSTMTLPIGTSHSGTISTSSQMQYRRTDLQGQVPSNNVDARQSIGNVTAQGFDFYKQDVAYRPNYVGSSMSSVTPTNGTLGCSLSQSLDPHNTNFGGSVDINLSRQSNFVKNSELDKSGLETSMQLHEGYLMGQQKFHGSFVSNNFGSLEDLATAMLRQDQVNHVRPNGDFGLGVYPPSTCP